MLVDEPEEVETEVNVEGKNYVPRDRVKQNKRKRSVDDEDETYIPTQENVQGVQTPPSGGRKKSTSRKRVQSPAVRKLKIKLKSKPIQEPSQPPSPSPPPELQAEPQQPFSPITTKTTITTTSTITTTCTITSIITTTSLEEIGDFNFLIDDVVKKLQKKVEEVLVEKKKLEDRVKSVESENSSLLKKVEADQTDIDILKVRIAELEEEKARRDEQNEYFKLKNKELEANKAMKEHEAYMMKKVLENLIGKSIEQRFEEIELEEVRAKRKAEIEAEMKNKGKGAQVEGVIEVTERAIVPSIVSESPIQDPCPISSVPYDENDEEDDILKDDVDEVYLVHDDDNDDGNDDDDQGTSGIKLNQFDINQQPEYQYKYVEDADNYDKVEVEDWSDVDQSENVNVDTSSFPMLAEFISQAKEDELRRKVAESVKNKSVHEM
ncbi:hypothetical protein Hanom_Chr01g00061901 [Helianthus anomalus]